MANRYLHLYNSVTEENNYINSNYEEPFVGVILNTRVDYNRKLIVNNNGYSYVDLGLPSGTLGATCNVGADNPEDVGDYFAFAEVEPKQTYTENNYKGYSSGSYTKYTSSDNKSYLDIEDDAANYNGGGDGKMPTSNQISELRNNTTRTDVTVNNKSCYKFEAANGNYIIIPKTGHMNGTSNITSYSRYGGGGIPDRVGSLSASQGGIFAGSSPSNNDKYCGCVCRPVIVPQRQQINPYNYEYVDLGLSSGTLGATMNVEAKSIGASGLYLQCGSTEPCNDSNYEAMVNNFSSEGVDPATFYMGEPGKTPTSEHIQELITGTTQEGTASYSGNLTGCIFTSKTNGKVLFIPAMGGYNPAISTTLTDDDNVYFGTSSADGGYPVCVNCSDYGDIVYTQATYSASAMPIRAIVDGNDLIT